MEVQDDDPDNLANTGYDVSLCEDVKDVKNDTITMEEHQACQEVWNREGMTTFSDYVRYYNNADVIGFVEAVEKMLVNERANNLDMFKESISLPSLTQRYLFMNLPHDEYFVGFGEQHKHLHKLMKDNNWSTEYYLSSLPWMRWDTN